MKLTVSRLIESQPELAQCEAQLRQAQDSLKDCYENGHKVLVCGNGGSAADSEHMVGELMKGFYSRRLLPASERQKFKTAFPDQGAYLADHLQGALPAISLVSQVSLLTAFANDVAPDMVYAQQVYGYGQEGDILVAISTSGNSENILQAARVARVKGMKTIALTGGDSGLLKEISDTCITAPSQETHAIQQYHLAIYHTLCAVIEEVFFGD